MDFAHPLFAKKLCEVYTFERFPLETYALITRKKTGITRSFSICPCPVRLWQYSICIPNQDENPQQTYRHEGQTERSNTQILPLPCLIPIAHKLLLEKGSSEKESIYRQNMIIDIDMYI